MTLSTRLATAMTALALFTAAIIGLLIYHDLATAILPETLEGLERSATRRAAEFDVDLRGARSDVFSFRSAVALEGIIRARSGEPDGIAESEWRARLARRFVAELEAKPAYQQFRIIGVADGGREILAVERVGGAIRIVPGAELQQRGDRPYFKEALAEAPGHVYLSTVAFDADRGKAAPTQAPVQYVAVSLQRADGQPFGILVITIDLSPLFDRMRADIKRGRSIYVVNATGQFLLHPDASLEVGAARTQPPSLHDDLPEFVPLLDAAQPQVRLIDTEDQSWFAVATAPVNGSGGQRLTVIETLPYSVIMQPVFAVGRSILLAALAAILVAIGLAVFFARSLSRPLRAITAAVEAFARGEDARVPLTGNGEVGVLARAFTHMTTEVQEKTAALARQTEERRRLFETSLDLILVVDRRGHFMQVSPSSAAILGYKPEDLLGRSAAELVLPDDLDSVRNEMRLARRGHVIRNFETRYVHQEGRVVTLAWTGVWSEPAQRHFFIGRDMTEQKLEQEKFRLAVESSPNGMIMADHDGVIVMANSEVERMFGYAPGELIGQPVDLLVPERLRRPHARHRRGFVTAPETRRLGAQRDLFGRHKNGSEIPVEIGLTPLRTPEGMLILSVIVDISERKRIERLKDEFVSTVSHELRTPLTSIAGSLGLLVGGTAGGLPEPTMRLLKIAHKNSERLVRLINDILDIEKIESGKMVFDLKKVDLLALIEQAVDQNRGYAESFGVRVTIAPSVESAFVRADVDRLTQVVTNLLSNAVKFSPRGGDVIVTTERGVNSVRLTVRDHGPGIPEDFKPRLFEKFAQADATDARQKGGTGLGLSIVKQIVTMLRGSVSFESPADGGTAFHVDLPRWEFLAALQDPDDLHVPNILICDDDHDVAALIAARLGEAGFTADRAFSGHEAIAMAAAKAYDAVLVDLTLPDRDGISLIQELRNQPQNSTTPIVVISFDTNRGREDVRSSSLDVLDWLDKPIDITRLVHVLRRPRAMSTAKRPRVLHVDDDPDVLALVSESLRATADVASAASADEALRAIADEHFDLVVLDLALSTGSGLDLLPELRDRDGQPIPVIIYSAQGANRAFATQVHVALNKTRSSIESLIAVLRKHMSDATPATQDKHKEVA